MLLSYIMREEGMSEKQRRNQLMLIYEVLNKCNNDRYATDSRKSSQK